MKSPQKYVNEGSGTPIHQDVQRWFRQEVGEKAVEMAGGRARLKILVLLACVLALDSANKATIGAIADQLEQALHIGNIGVGLLVTATTGIGALATLPFGVLTDRVHRNNLLAVCITLWGAAMAVCGASNSFLMLLLSMLALGVVIAAVLPAVASLVGDYFHPADRGRMWGYILGGELFGAGFGILIAGGMASLLSWRFAFWILAIVSLVLAVAVWWWLPEPARGGQSHLLRDKEEIPTTEELENRKQEENQQQEPEEEETDEVEKKVEEQDVDERESQVLDKNPADMSFWNAVRYILSIRTNVLLILASSCGYFFFTGLRTFIVIFARGRFDLGQGMGKIIVVLLGLGAIFGVLITGRTADKLIERGHISARVTVGGIAFMLTAVLFLAGFFLKSLIFAAPLFFLAAASLGGTNAPLDAARLDIMHSRLWGRAEGVRVTFRYSFEAVAPILFGWVSAQLGSGGGMFGGGGGQGSSLSSNAAPLAHTFMLMLVPVIVAGIILYFARKTYPRDVATMLESEKATSE